MKTLFLKNKELSDQLRAVVKTDWFLQAVAFARSEFINASPNTDQLRGAKMFEDTLLTLADEADEAATFPETGLEHDLDVRKLETSKPSK